jgi:hypothetical protein
MQIYDGGFLDMTKCSTSASDSNEDREMDFDEHHDFMDQHIPAGQFPTADPGPIHHFVSGMPDWMNINQEDLDRALESLQVPIPLKGPIPPGISLQEAIQVNQRHNIHIRQHQNIILNSNRYTISYTDIVHYIGITLRITYTISDTISCTMFDVSI